VRNDLRTLRTGLGLSQADVSAAMGVSRQTINALETGRYQPSLPLAMKLANYFASTVEGVFHLEEEEEEED